ncbi:hypothetical protein U8V72_20890 [Priestia filamentosa]|uniref:hypothetical protein n=1 Tax=Priestia filamentosa TaxID=1402861 RepID=UPI00397AC23B
MDKKPQHEVKPETYVEEFAKEFDLYLKDLNKGYLASKDTKLSLMLKIKNSWEVLYRGMQKLSPARPNLLFAATMLVTLVPSGLSIWNYPKIAIPVVGIGLATSLFCLRHFTLKAMETPGDKLFHHAIFAKRNPRLKATLQKFYEDSYFNLERLVQEVKTDSLSKDVRKDYAERIKELNAQLAAYKEEIAELKEENETLSVDYEEALIALVDTEEERNYMVKMYEYVNRFIEGMNVSLAQLIHNDFGKEFLQTLNFDQRYSLYRLEGIEGEEKFVYEGSGGLTGIDKQSIKEYINLTDEEDTVIQAYFAKNQEVEGKSRRYHTIAKGINIAQNESWVVVLYFQKREFAELKKDEEFATIRLNTIFDLFWVCLEIVSKYQAIKNEFEEAVKNE